jgi:hypothetical protein
MKVVGLRGCSRRVDSMASKAIAWTKEKCVG